MCIRDRLYAPGETKEWCLTLDEDDWITGVSIGGNGQWYMLGHVFWSEEFSKIFRRILEEEYGREETRDKLWEALYIEHLDLLKLKVRKFADHEIYEFDSLEELREFDRSYMEHSGSAILQSIADILHCLETVSYTHLDVYKRQCEQRFNTHYIYSFL